MEELVRQLTAQAAESRGLDYKGSMAWGGSKPERAELIRDLMCFSNTPDGGYILIGVEEGADAWMLTGVTPDQAETFDPTRIGDLASNYCSILPLFSIHRVEVDGKLYVLIAVKEFEDQPVLCTKDCQDPDGKLVLRAGTIYARTVDARCSETRSAEDMQRVLDMAVRKRGDALLAQIAGLFEQRGAPPLVRPTDERFQVQVDSAEEWLVENDLSSSCWQVEIRPQRFIERLRQSRSELAAARDGAATTLRGWDFPHTDRDDASTFAGGIQSVTHWAVHHEAYRLYLSGLFIWRKRHQEDFEDDRFHNTLIFESVIWSYTEIWTFASRLLSELIESGQVLVKITLTGLEGRSVKPSRPSVSVRPSFSPREDSHTQDHVLSLGDLRADHLQYAAADAMDLLELFGVQIQPDVVRSWQDKLLNREF